MKKFLFLTAISLILVVPNTYASDLVDIYQQALVADQSFQGARASYLSATEAYPQARAALLPFVDLTANAGYSRVRNALPTTIGKHKYNLSRSYEYTLELQQPILDIQALFQLHLANYKVKQAAATYASAAQDLILRVSTAYFNVLEAKDNLRFTNAKKRATARQLDQARQRYKVGLDAITSVYDAEATYNGILAEEIAAKNAVDNNREKLREITGQYYTHLANLKSKFPLLKPEPTNIEKWVSFATKQNFLLQAARFGVIEARENIKVQFSTHLPTVAVTGSYDQAEASHIYSPGDADTRVGTVGLKLNLPIFQGGYSASAARQAKYDYQNAVANMKNTYRKTVVSTRQVYNSIVAGISKIKADKRAIVSQEASLNSTDAALKVGTRTIVDLLQAQQALFQAQKNLSTDQYAYINNVLLLKSLAGTLNLGDVRAINSWLKNKK